MVKDGKKLAIGLGITGAVAALIYIATKAKAAPPLIYTCPVCGAEFTTYEELLAHIQTEHPEQPLVYTCPYCGATFSTESELNYHIETQHPPVVYTCPYCGATFSTEAELNYHIEIAHPVVLTNVTVGLKNPPSGANKWQMVICDWNATKFLYWGVNDHNNIEGIATFEIPAGWEFPLRIVTLGFYYEWQEDGEWIANELVEYRIQSWDPSAPNYREVFIPDYGNYYYNVATGQFEKL